MYMNYKHMANAHFEVDEVKREDGSKVQIGDRLECDGFRATLMYIGLVPPTKGTLFLFFIMIYIMKSTFLSEIIYTIILIFVILLLSICASPTL